MKILHFSDTHLGFNDLDKVGPNGVNLREQDFYDSFKFVIDQALKIKPDLLIHSGDFFHRPSPPNRPMIFALEQLNRLAAANIPIVIIAGNHETPKTIYTSPILKAFNTINGVYPVFGQGYQMADFGELIVHGLPHINDERVLLEEMDKIEPVPGKFNIILLHTSIGKRYIMEEFGEQLYPPERLELLNKFDYVALGHWHNFQKVNILEKAWYAGSTERMSDTEAEKDKGFCMLNLEKNQPVNPVFHPVPARPWFRVDIKKCEEKTVEEIEKELIGLAANQPHKNAIISIYFHQIQNLQSIALTQRKLEIIFEDALQVHGKRIFAASDRQHDTQRWSNSGKSTTELLADFIKEQTEEKADGLIEKAKGYFDTWEKRRK